MAWRKLDFHFLGVHQRALLSASALAGEKQKKHGYSGAWQNIAKHQRVVSNGDHFHSCNSGVDIF
jgi:hypothetical protein